MTKDEIKIVAAEIEALNRGYDSRTRKYTPQCAGEAWDELSKLDLTPSKPRAKTGES